MPRDHFGYYLQLNKSFILCDAQEKISHVHGGRDSGTGRESKLNSREIFTKKGEMSSLYCECFGVY